MQSPAGLSEESFNGAAAFRPRRPELGWSGNVMRIASMGPRPFGRGDLIAKADWANGVCFNGAAAFRPRRRFGESLRRAASRLQWGRGLSAAETALQCDLRFADGASMGPRPFGRGDSRPFAAIGTKKRFNGAAAFRPRRLPTSQAVWL